MTKAGRDLQARLIAPFLVALSVCFADRSNAAEEPLFVSKRITPPGEYTSGIEGPALDASGNLYVVNFQQSGTIGKFAAGASQSQLFTSLPAGSIGNGIRFDRQGRMYVADFRKHKVWVIEPGKTTPRVYFHSDRFNQPNDLAIAADGTLYASDPHFAAPAGGQTRTERRTTGRLAALVISASKNGLKRSDRCHQPTRSFDGRTNVPKRRSARTSPPKGTYPKVFPPASPHLWRLTDRTDPSSSMVMCTVGRSGARTRSTAISLSLSACQMCVGLGRSPTGARIPSMAARPAAERTMFASSE